MDRERRADPTLVRNQPSLATSSGRIWLVVGALFAAVCLGVLLLQWANAQALALVGAGVVVALYLAMVAVRVAIAPGRARLATLAVLLIAMAVWTLGVLFAIVATEV